MADATTAAAPGRTADEIKRDPIVASAVDRAGDAVVDAKEFAGEITLAVVRDRIREVATAFKEDGFNYLVDLSGIDYSKYPGHAGERFSVSYTLYSFGKNKRVRLKIATDEATAVPSVTSVWKTANWHERETYDMLGIRFEGHPNLERILTWEGFNGHPLRKDFPLRGIDTGARIYPEVFPEGGGPKAGSTGKDPKDVNLYEGEWKRYGTSPIAEIAASRARDGAHAPAPELAGVVADSAKPTEEAPWHDPDKTIFDVQDMEVNFGPQHPSTHGVLRVLLKINGERIVEATPVIGYLHRGTEKLFENMSYPQCIPHTDRMDYIAAATNNLGFVEAVEKLMGITGQIPRRAQLLRVILSELQRISSHLLWLATHAIDIGAMTPFFYCFREREQVLDLFEAYCGARLTLNCMRIGGMPEDTPPGWLDDVEAFNAKFDAAMDEYESLLTNNRIWKRRTVGIGVISPEEAIDWGITGPPLRGSGVEWDLRRAQPYECYPELAFEIPVGKNGDTYDRYLVRMVEMRQSRRIIQQCIPLIKETPAGDIKAKISRVIRPPEGEVYHSVESPKGELGYYIVSDGKSQQAYRCHVRPPSFVNLQALPAMARGHLVSDLVALIGTIDIVLGEVDR